MTCILSHNTSLELLSSPLFPLHDYAMQKGAQPAYLLDTPPLQPKAKLLQTWPSCSKPASEAEVIGHVSAYGLNPPINLLVNSKNERLSGSTISCHVSTLAPNVRGFLKINNGLLATTPELSFVLMAKELPLIELICLGYEICGYYSLRSLGSTPLVRRRPLSTASRISAFIGQVPHLGGVVRARRAIKYVVDGSASPAETACSMLLTLPNHLGGCGLPAPAINHEVARFQPLQEKSQSPSTNNNAKCDLLWKGVVVEYDSKQEHGTYEKMEQDAVRRNDLSPSVTVLQATKAQLASNKQTSHLAKLIARHLSFRTRTRLADYPARQRQLRDAINNAHHSNWL